MDFETLLEQKNKTLEKVQIKIRYKKLYLFYRVPGGSSTKLGLRQNALLENLPVASKVAQELNEQLLNGTYKASEWTGKEIAAKRQSKGELDVPDFCISIHKSFSDKAFDGCFKNPEEYYKQKYQPLLNKLKRLHGIVTHERLVDFLNEQTPSNRATFRSIFAQTIRTENLKIYGLSYRQMLDVKTGYTKKVLQVKDIPNDVLLRASLDKIEIPHWKWMCKMMLVYGIRPREIADCHLEYDYKLIIKQSKTGPRIARPLPISLAKELKVEEVNRPPYPYSKLLVERATNYLTANKKGHKPKLDFDLYTYRHAYAIRGIIHGIDVGDMARYMGHSVDIHKSTYQAWFNPLHEKMRWEKIAHKF